MSASGALRQPFEGGVRLLWTLSRRLLGLPGAVRYGVALGAVLAATWFRLSMDPLWGLQVPFISFYPAIMLGAWVGGLGPGLAVTLVSAATANYFWIEPVHSFRIQGATNVLALATFLANGSLISVLNEGWRRGAKKLIEAQQRLRVTLGSIGDGVITTDADGRVTGLNAVAQSLVGWTEAEAAGRPLAEIFAIVNEQTRQPAPNPVDKVLREGVVAGLANHTVLVAKNGREIPIDDSAAPIRGEDGALEGVVLVFREITQRRELDRARAAQLAIYRLAIEAAPAAILMVDAAGTVVLVNALAERLLGYTREELLGQPVERLVPQRYLERHQKFREGFAAGPAARPMGAGRDLYARRKDGSEVAVEIGLAPLETAEGRFVLAAVTDVTARKKAEAALWDAGRRKDEFLATIAHELRNPLGAITSAAQLLKQLGPLEGNARWARDVVERQAAHLARIVDDLLDVSRISRGQIVLQREPVPVSTVVALALETAQPLFDARRQSLTSTLPKEPVWVDGDATRLAQVVGNLLSNASRYSARGGSISLEVENQADRVTLRVRDQGIGIAPEMLPRVFDAFAQGSPSAAGPASGLGLGLTLARRLTELHGGRIEAHSEGPGRGSEFVVQLPALAVGPAVIAGPAPAAAAPRPLATHAPVRRRILVVDDNADSGQALALALSLAGQDVRLAADGPSALAEAAAFRPEAAVLDIGLPGMDGYELAGRMRAEGDPAGLVLVALTGYGQEKDRRRGLESGFDHYLVKPVSPESILAVLSATLSDAPPAPRAGQES